MTVAPAPTGTEPRNAPHQPRAFVVARRLYGAFFVAMAGVNLVVAATDLRSYGSFADDAWLPGYADLWQDLVAPNLEVLVPALIAFELVAGLALWRARGRVLRLALWAVVAFHLAIAPGNLAAASNLLLVAIPLALLWWHAVLERR